MFLCWIVASAGATEGDRIDDVIIVDKDDRVAAVDPDWEEIFDDLDCGPNCLDPDVNGLYDLDVAGVPVVRALILTEGTSGFELWASQPGFGATAGTYSGALTLEREAFSFTTASAHAWDVVEVWCDWIRAEPVTVWWIDRGDYLAPVSIPSNFVPASTSSAVVFGLYQTPSLDYHLRLHEQPSGPPLLGFYQATNSGSGTGAFSLLEDILDIAAPCEIGGPPCVSVSQQASNLIYVDGRTVYRQQIIGSSTTAPFCNNLDVHTAVDYGGN